ncbi:MAG: carboxypeptidase-like regulatory domain-containing protein [bacterium]|nr:carboxypeptidase-like regulatory domain-containing protein [bacterium]
MRRPSALVALCAVIVVSAFVARGDLRIDGKRSPTSVAKSEASITKPKTRPKTGQRVPAPVVRAKAPAPKRTAAMVVVKGRVLDALGYAVAQAEVEASAAASTKQKGAVVTTDAEGRFEIVLPDANFADLWVRGDGHSPRWLRAALNSPDPLVVQLEPAAPWDQKPAVATAPVLTGEGTVRNNLGEPLAGAYVTALGSGLWSRTDEIGRYSLPLYRPETTLLVHDPAIDAAARSAALKLGRDHGVVPLPELVAAPGGAIRGLLRDSDGNPVEGAPVLVAGDGVTRVCESGTSGRFQLRGLAAGRYEVRPHPWTGRVGRSQEVMLDGDVAECELKLEPLQSRKVQVCRENGSPVGKAYVAVLFAGTRSGVARADDDGWAEVSLASGPVQFEVRGEDGESAFAVQGFDSEQTRLVVTAP